MRRLFFIAEIYEFELLLQYGAKSNHWTAMIRRALDEGAPNVVARPYTIAEIAPRT